jgi:hypothetical protein
LKKPISVNQITEQLASAISLDVHRAEQKLILTYFESSIIQNKVNACIFGGLIFDLYFPDYLPKALKMISNDRGFRRSEMLTAGTLQFFDIFLCHFLKTTLDDIDRYHEFVNHHQETEISTVS